MRSVFFVWFSFGLRMVSGSDLVRYYSLALALTFCADLKIFLLVFFVGFSF
jgi:hypothetical protein